MFFRRHIWVDEQKRQEKLNGHGGQEKTVSFGYQRVPEDEKVKWVLRHFNTVASKYDVMNTLLSFGIHHLWKRTAVKMLRLNAGDWVVDLCGGTGDLSKRAAGAVGSFGRVVLYDINWAMMAAGRPKVARSRWGKRILYVQGDAEQISLWTERFDAVMVGFGIRNLTHMEEGFREIHRILKPGGKLICLEFSKPTSFFFRWLYDLYSFYIMPSLGELIVGSKKAYTHLPESIRMFPLPDELTAILEKVGFSHVIYRKLTNGIAVIHLARKV